MPEQVESWIFITSTFYLGVETANSFPNWRTRGNCREDGAHKILQETPTVFVDIFSEEAAVNILKKRDQTGPL